MALPYVITSPLSLSEPSSLRLISTGGFIDLIPPSTLPADYNFTLPPNIGNNLEILTTDGSGNTSWSPVPTTVSSIDFLSTFDTIIFTTGSGTYVTIPGTTINLAPFITSNFSPYSFQVDFHLTITGVAGTVYELGIFISTNVLPLVLYERTIDGNAPTTVAGISAIDIESALTSSISLGVRILSGASISITNRFISTYQNVRNP